MRVLGLVCSPRKGGNTELMVREALEVVREAGSETEIILVADKNIMPCNGCGVCLKEEACPIKDDMAEIYQALESADGVILGTPVYFASVSAQAKIIIDRSYALLGTRRLRGKVAGALVVARRVGAFQTLSLLYTFFVVHRMVIAAGGIGYGVEKGDVKNGVGGSYTLSALQEARAVGKNVALMLQRLSKC